MENRVYSVVMDAVAVTAAITLIQITASSTQVVELVRAWVSQSNQTSSAQQRVYIIRKTAAATVTAATPRALNNGDPASGVTAGTNASAEGTDGNIVMSDAFNVLNGWLWVSTPMDRITVPPSGIIALKLPAAPGSSMTTEAGVVFKEIG